MNGDFEVVGVDNDGGLLCRDLETGEEYNCGDTLESFGVENLSTEELEAISK